VSVVRVREIGAAQDGPDPAAEFPDRERLGDVVVGADLEAQDLVALIVARREHDDRHLAAASQAAADLDAVDPGQHHVEDDEVEALGCELVKRLAPVERRDHLVAVAPQRV